MAEVGAIDGRRHPVTNRWIAENREVVFTSGSEYQAETPIVGRDTAIGQLESVVAGREGTRCVLISDHLGAGKTFLLQNAVRRLVKENGFDEQRELIRLPMADLPQERAASTILGVSASVLVIDDVDRKFPLSQIDAAIGAAAVQADKGRTIILIGDYTLRNLRRLSPMTKVGFQRVPLEPLDTGLLRQALAARIMHQLVSQRRETSETATGASEKAAAELFDDHFMSALLPKTDPSIAVFRNVLDLLRSISGALAFDDKPCQFTSETFRLWMRLKRRQTKMGSELDARRRKFLEGLYGAIHDAVTRGRVFTQLSTGDCMQLGGFSGDETEYETQVLAPLARAGTLVTVGIPYGRGADLRHAYPPPYLPGVLTWAEAVLLRAGGAQ